MRLSLGHVVAAQESSADLSKLSGLLVPGAIVQTLSGDAYRVASKVASADGISFRLADLSGKQVQTPANFHPVSTAFARTAAWMRFVFAYNSDFDLYVKEYIRAAGLPVDDKMNWAKWFQYKYQAKLNWLTQDPEILDEAIHQVIITALAHRKDLTKFDPKRLPADLQKKPVAEQVTAYLEWLFGKRVSEAKEFIQEKLQPQEEVSMYQPGDEESGDEGEMNILDTEEHAAPGGAQEVEEQSDLQRLRDQFAAYLSEDETPREIEKLLVLYDYFAANVGRKPKIGEYEAYWQKATGLGKDSLKPVYSKFYRYIGDFMVASGLVSADRAKARAQAVGVKSSLNVAAVDETEYVGDNDPAKMGAGMTKEQLLHSDEKQQEARRLEQEHRDQSKPFAERDTRGFSHYGPDAERGSFHRNGPERGSFHRGSEEITSDAQVIPQAAEAGPSNDEKVENQHEENGVPVLDGALKSPERPNVNAMREALDTQAEMEVGMPIEQKQEEVAEGKTEGGKQVEIESGGAKIVININAARPRTEEEIAAETGRELWSIHKDPGADVEDMDINVEEQDRAQFDEILYKYLHQVDPDNELSISDAVLQMNPRHQKAMMDELLTLHYHDAELEAQASSDQDQVDRTGDKEVDFNTKDAANANCECGHHKTYHDGKNKMCHGGTKEEPCNCDGRFKKAKTSAEYENPGFRTSYCPKCRRETKHAVRDNEKQCTVCHTLGTLPDPAPHKLSAEDEDATCPGCGDPLNNAEGPYCGGKICPKSVDPSDMHEGAAGAAPALAVPKKVVLRKPTDSEMEHERMRFNQAYKSGDTERYLQRRLDTIQNPQKLFSFALMLENENWHTFNQQVFDKLKRLGWDGSWPKDASAKTAAIQVNYYVQIMRPQASIPGLDKGMVLALGYTNASEGAGGAQQLQWWKEMPELRYKQIVQQIKKTPGLVDRQRAESLYHAIQNTGNIMEAEGATTDQVLEYFKDCPECSHPMDRHKAPYGCEYERGDREGGEGPNGPEPAQAMGPCGCMHGLEPGGKTSGYGDTGTFPHNPEGGDGHTGPSQPIVVDEERVLHDPNWMDDKEKNVVAAPVQMQAPARKAPQGPTQKSYGTPVGEKKDTDVIDQSDPNAQSQDQDSGSGFEQQPRRKTIMPELPNAEMILQLNSSLKVGGLKTAECEPGREDECAQFPWGHTPPPAPWEDIKRSSDLVDEEMNKMAHEKIASYAQELMQDFMDEAMSHEFLWVKGREKGMRFAPRGIDQMGSDPHLRGSYQGHPQFGNIPDDMHQVAALMDDLENGSVIVEADPRATEHLKNLVSEYNETMNDEFEEGEDLESYPDDPMTDEEFAEGGTVEAATKTAEPGAAPAPAPVPEENDDDYKAVGPFRGNLVKYDQEDFVALVNSKYGWAVSGQADDLLNGGDPEDANSNALYYILEFAKRKGETELAQYLQGYLDTIGYKRASAKRANPLATVPKVDVSPAPSAPMAAPVANSKRAELRNKIAARKAARAAEKLAAQKVARLRQVAADEAPAASDGLEQLGNAFGELAQSVHALRENLDLVPFNPEEHEEMPIAARLAAAREASKKFASAFRQIVADDPAALEQAVREVYQGLNETSLALENYAENMGLDLGMVVGESTFEETPSVGPESEEKQLKDEEEHQEEPKPEEEEKESSGRAFTTDRDHAGHPREAAFDVEAELIDTKEGADGSNNFVTDRDDKGEPKQPFRVEVPRI